jgi:uncharacterized damage-inducible protein DinB
LDGGLFNELEDTTMAISEALLPEFNQEAATTRKFLERLPEDKLNFKPHEKSMVLGRLAGHIAEMPGWGTTTLETEQLDFAPVGAPPFQPLVAASREHVLGEFDKGVAAFRVALPKTSDQDFMKPWTLLSGGKVLFAMPRVAVIRSMVLNHIIHHRAQLGVYYRLTGVPVPPTYGPSADEGR